MGDERRHERLESDQALWTKRRLASFPMMGFFSVGGWSQFSQEVSFLLIVWAGCY